MKTFFTFCLTIGLLMGGQESNRSVRTLLIGGQTPNISKAKEPHLLARKVPFNGVVSTSPNCPEKLSAHGLLVSKGQWLATLAFENGWHLALYSADGSEKIWEGSFPKDCFLKITEIKL